MRQYELNGAKRACAGKKAAKTLRAAGQIPCNLIGKGEATSFTVNEKDLKNLLYTSQVYLVNLNIDGEQCKAVLKEAQYGPINEEILHLDFLKIDENEPITVKIPVKLEGHAEGVKAGGKLVKQLRELTVKGLYTAVPERLLVDVTAIELGKTLKVSECKFEGLDILTSKDAIVAAVRATRASRQAGK